MSRLTRRKFIQTTAVSAAGLTMIGPGIVNAKEKGKVRFALIGVGGQGRTHHKWVIGEKVVALCDTDSRNLKAAAEKFPDAKQYSDYRKLYEKGFHKEFDAVVIATPDHHHYPAAMLALKHGKHVYCEKPLTWSVEQAHQLLIEAKKQKVATQMGNQGHAGIGWRYVLQWIQRDLIGDVSEYHNWTDRPWWRQGPDWKRPAGSAPVPKWMDWETWIGPAEMRPFHHQPTDRWGGVYHPFNWRGWWDFGAGAMGDMACHIMDGMFWAMGTDYPTSIEPTFSTGHNGDSFPSSTTIKYTFDATQKRKGYLGYWYDGGRKPARPSQLPEGLKMPSNGTLIVGTKGIIITNGAYGDGPTIWSKSLREELKPQLRQIKKELVKSPGHYNEFLLACRGEKPIDFPGSNFRYSAPMTEIIQMGNVAVRVNKKIIWDPKARKITNLPSANQYLNRTPRKGWDV